MDASPGWYPDPLGRYDHRYWDGARWTDHAARAGEAVLDPLAPEAPAEQTTSPDWSASAKRTAQGTEGLAVVSLILSLVWLFGIGSIAGIITGIVARKRIRESGGASTGSGLALAGIIVGIVTLLLTLLAALLLGALLARDVTFTTSALGMA